MISSITGPAAVHGGAEHRHRSLVEPNNQISRHTDLVCESRRTDNYVIQILPAGGR